MNFPTAQALPFDDVSTVCCHGCGMYDASLRYSAHPKVVSNLVKANESTRVGIWCARCRGIEAAKATAISLLAGWWSLRGPARTVAAVRSNLQGGEQQPTTNARMLRAIALHEYDKQNLEFAAMFANAANITQPQRENSRLLHDLNKAGHNGALSSSPWRFAAWGPVVVFALVIVTLVPKVFNVMTATKSGPSVAAPVQRASLAGAAPRSSSGTARRVTWSPTATADELEQQLKTTSDERLARAYLQARLREVRADLPARIRRGDTIGTVEMSINALRQQPDVALLLAKPGLSNAYDKLTAAFSDAGRYYHGGAPVEAIERTAGESLNVTVMIELNAIEADLRGHTERSDALGAEVDRRAESLFQMKRDLRIRGAVINLLSRALDACLEAANR